MYSGHLQHQQTILSPPPLIDPLEHKQIITQEEMSSNMIKTLCIIIVLVTTSGPLARWKVMA